MKGTDRKRWELTVAKGQGSGREAVAERSPRQTLDHRNTKPQRGRVRATSVLANAKSKDHQDASSRAAWHEGKAHVLTQGDLDCESRPGVSRGRSSEESRRKAEGAKGRRNGCKATGEPMSRRGRTQKSAARSEGSRHAARVRSAPMVQPSQAMRRESIRTTSCGAQETKTAMQELLMVQTAIRPRRLIPATCPTAGCGKPHVRWCGSPDGCNPVRATRSSKELQPACLKSNVVSANKTRPLPSLQALQGESRNSAVLLTGSTTTMTRPSSSFPSGAVT